MRSGYFGFCFGYVLTQIRSISLIAFMAKFGKTLFSSFGKFVFSDKIFWVFFVHVCIH